jgi:hypothetical protein
MRTKLLLVAVGVAAALSLSGVALAAAPPTLTGETLVSGTAATTDYCTVPGGAETVTFTGTTTGPYAGTYSETITLSYTASGQPSMTGSGTFTITAGAMTVAGTTSITGIPVCRADGGLAFAFSGSYDATITTPGGGFHDQGSTDGNGSTLGLSETFSSSLPAPIPLLPTSAAQCKDGGWRSFGVFKNQGDCVSFVATRGKNLPG